jgi:CHAT domain-containing protein
MMVPAHLVLADANHPQYAPATRERLKQELPRYSLALMATHGVYDEHHPWTNSGLHTADFSGAAADSGLLTIRDFYDMDLSRTRLLLLTACESALAQNADSTGEQLGIPSAILASGAGAVIGSLWLVEDVATALLVRQLFIEMTDAASASNSNPAAALARAQQWLRRLTLPELDIVFTQLGGHAGRLATGTLQQVRDALALRGERPFSHPVCWAGFACYGAS